MEGKISRVSTTSTGSRGLSDTIKKVAVTMVGQSALFMELNQNIPLNAIIQDISQRWNLAIPEDYALQFSEPNGQTYITEKSRKNIKNGNVLQLTDSPSKAARTIIEKLKTGTREDKVNSLQRLSVIANDATFAQEFKKDGLKLIIDSVMAGDKGFMGDPLAYLLKSFVALMDHDVMSWDDLEPQFIKQVCESIAGKKAVGTGCLQPALDILESVILRCENEVLPRTLEEHVTPNIVMNYIQSSSSDVQKSAIALLNAMFMKSSPDKRKKISDCTQSKEFRAIITNSVLQSGTHVGAGMACQLSKLQRCMLNLYEPRMKEVVHHHHDSAQMNAVKVSIEKLRKIVFDFTDMGDQNTPASRKSHVSKDFKKLGFTDMDNPVADFEHGPPGLLALDNMLHFAEHFKENYIKVVLENSGRADKHDCPFVQASIKLTKILCDFLKIGEAPYDEEHFYFPMFFNVDKPMEEFFSQCIQLLNRTWKDMRATKEDFSKVETVVREQITRALDKKQLPATLENFRQNLGNYSFDHMKQIWEKERILTEEKADKTRPILELREMLMPEIKDLIVKHRLNYMEGGTRFPKYDAKGNRNRNRYQYWRLAPNRKALHYGDCTESGDPTIEQLQNKVSILEIKQVLMGKDCPHVKGKKFQSDYSFALSVETPSPEDQDQTFFFSLSSDQEYAYNIWIDGINALLGKPLTSPQFDKDKETLLSMEIKLQLLETEGITIPESPPTIPPLPDNFDFAYTIT